MSHIFAITNQKGGVGKTTTSVNLSASMAATKRNVLLIDLDPQGNATMGCGVDKHDLELSACDLLLGEATINDVIQPLERWGFDLLPGNADLTVAEIKLATLSGREFKLRDALKEVIERYEYVFIDCPPSLNMLTVNAMVAASGVLIPMQCEYYALEGLTALLQTVEDIRKSVNPALKVEGLLRTMFDPRNNLSNDVSQQLLEHFGKQVLNTIIPRNIRLAEAPSHGTPILHYDRNSRGALAYFTLAGELLGRNASSRSAIVGAKEQG